jgi:ATP-binding cassette subfamily F protein 3
MGRTAPKVAEKDLRSLLGCFLFSGDDVFKPLGVLSGGERNRYALARMLMMPGNFLLLDEPTNHLDMRAKDVLLTALQEFSGTVVFVSHDRYFIDKLATRVFEIGDGKVEIYPGNYEDYLWRKQGGDKTAPTLDDVPGKKLTKSSGAQPFDKLRAGFPAGVAGSGPQPVATPQPANGNRSAESETAKKRVNPIKRKQMEERIHDLEEEIERAEAAIASLETAMQNFVSADESQRQSQELDRHKASHAALLAEWEELSGELQESD